MKKIKKLWNDNKAPIKSYLRAVFASAVTMGLALAADLAPQYAILIGSIAAPLAKWADKTEKEFGLTYRDWETPLS